MRPARLRAAGDSYRNNSRSDGNCLWHSGLGMISRIGASAPGSVPGSPASSCRAPASAASLGSRGMTLSVRAVSCPCFFRPRFCLPATGLRPPNPPQRQTDRQRTPGHRHLLLPRQDVEPIREEPHREHYGRIKPRVDANVFPQVRLVGLRQTKPPPPIPGEREEYAGRHEPIEYFPHFGGGGIQRR